MHVLILPSWYPKTKNDLHGVFFRDQALALHSYGHKVGVIAPLMRSLRTLYRINSEEKCLGYESDEGLLTYRKEVFAWLPRLPYGNYCLFKRAARELLERYIVENGKPDILHAHAAIFGGAAGAELSAEFEIPLVLTEHSSGFARGLYSRWQNKLAGKAIQNSQARIAVSPSLGQGLEKQFLSSQVDWQWIPNVVAGRFKVPENKERPKGPFRFLNIAVMTKNKGQFDLLQAFSQAVIDGLDVELWLVGDGPIRSDLEDMVAKLGLESKVRFWGLMDPERIPNLLAEADAVVVSSHYETFGVVAAEALMVGVPVIATRCGGPECIVKPDDGILVPPRQPEELERAMREICQTITLFDPSEISERAKARFGGAAVAEQLTAVYQEMLSVVSHPRNVS